MELVQCVRAVEEVAVSDGRARHVVNRQQHTGCGFVAAGSCDTEEQSKLPLALVTSDKSWTPPPRPPAPEIPLLC